MMKRLYWRPKQVSRTGLLLVGMISVGGMLAVELFRVDTKQRGFDLKVQAADLARRCMEAIKEERIKRGYPIDVEADPAETPRATPSLIPVGKRRRNFKEVETTWSRSVALTEARRCLRCDYREPESGE